MLPRHPEADETAATPALSQEERARIFEEERLRRRSLLVSRTLEGVKRTATFISTRVTRTTVRQRWAGGIIVVLLLAVGTYAGTRSGDRNHPAARSVETSVDDDNARPETPASYGTRTKNNVSFAEAESDPAAYANSTVAWRGKVVGGNTPQDWGGIGFFVRDPETERQFVARWYSAPKDHQVQDGAWVQVDGEIRGLFENENAWGGTFRAPDVEAKEVKMLSRSEVVAPTQRTVKVERSSSQHGITVTLEKLELAERETRVHIRAKNDSAVKATFYAGVQAKIIAAGRQIDQKTGDWETLQEQPSTDILPGAETQGYVLFPALADDTKEVRVFLGSPSSSNYSLDFSDISFDVKL